MYFALPQEYRQASADDLKNRIRAARERMGNKLCILVHHYQRIEVVEFGDHVGDSYGLSKIAANRKEAEVIVFCGVHFMAESADILTEGHQSVYLPNPLAGCPMADMAEILALAARHGQSESPSLALEPTAAAGGAPGKSDVAGENTPH